MDLNLVQIVKICKIDDWKDQTEEKNEYEMDNNNCDERFLTCRETELYIMQINIINNDNMNVEYDIKEELAYICYVWSVTICMICLLYKDSQ